VEATHRAERIDAAGLRDPKLLDTWRGLAVICSNPFLTPEWFHTALDAFPDQAAFAIGWWVGEELRGVLPFLVGSKGPWKVVRFPNFRRGDWYGPACRPEDEAAMARDCAELLQRESANWNVLRLDRVEVDAAWLGAFAGDDAPLSRGSRRRTDELPFIDLREGGYEGWLASRTGSFRRFNPRRRKHEREHGLSFRMTKGAAELEQDMDIFFRLHDERWAGRGGSTMKTADSREAMRSFAREMLDLGWLRLWIAEADDEPTAAWYGWRIGERYCFALSGMQSRLRGIGTILTAHTVEQAAAEGAGIYDMMWGEEEYKERFETGRRQVETRFIGAGAASTALLRGAVGGVKTLEALPPGVRKPLGRMRRALRRS
jgi:CelD/BcsL family acetyltransferase involved in cellulose biosynthesis